MPKKHGTVRMCDDYRNMNAQTENDAFLLLRINQIWSILSRAIYFTFFDLLMGYHQFEVDLFDRAKTAFLTYCGLYICNVMLFGLCNSPATFQQLMERVMGTLIGVGVLVYLDDVLIYADTPKQLIFAITAVLKLLAIAGLNCKNIQFLLFTKRVHLGRVVSKHGIFPDPAKHEKIRQWPKPDKGKGFAFFLGLCNYYRDLIP